MFNFKIGAAVVAFGIATEIVYQVYVWWKNKHKKKQIADVLFFPDKEVACKDFFQKNKGCTNGKCRFSHRKNSLSELYRHLSSARRSLDVCVYTLCSKELCDIVISQHRRQLAVRVITDDDQINMSGAQVWRFRAADIPVRTGNPSYYMHHKYVVIDGDLLVNGSFNWTRQAITGNQENVLITNIPQIVDKFVEEFEKLWIEFNPSNFHKSELHQERYFV